ncbi:HupE/UreJ family protein [Bradyrhizobium barranii subsp. barranii]|uniref:HupE/UreJ family protein n=1 Tax=Bradyrhizobium barranii subsp. barranii TaxID=2823807 RepID=A0A939MEZ8_9BRAD|nr:HupE/UreJ family protein [Bradyrhizobium barranii]UEM12045.1 HupE/UreJ family protein [Bradyrhizobium barranii subsp. barranii]
MMRIIPICVAALSLLAAPAFAHPIPGAGSSFDAGLVHPFSGADHLIAITLVGTWSGLVGGSARAVWPLTFLIAMLGGFAAASAGLQMGFVEAAISLSVVALGAFVAFEFRMPVMLGAAAVGLFAFFHGHAHGTEAAAMLVPYVIGFTTATAALLLTGMVIGLWGGNATRRSLLRAAGVCAGLVGLLLLGGVA